MLDTNGRKYAQPFLDAIADVCVKAGLSANCVTTAAFAIGVLSAFAVCLHWYWLGVFLLWLSGVMDAVDGTIARKTGSSGPLGTLLDVVFDRIVEILILLALIHVEPELAAYVAVVLGSIIISMTVFLTVGAAAQNNSNKSFYYQAGLAERTEGFIMLSLAVLLNGYRAAVLLVFAAMILFTAGQRFVEAVRIFKKY